VAVEEALEAPVAGHAPLARAGVGPDVLQGAEVARSQRLDEQLLGDAQAAAYVAELAVLAGIDAACAVHEATDPGGSKALLRINLNTIVRTPGKMSSEVLRLDPVAGEVER
jgi:hypothetical protein